MAGKEGEYNAYDTYYNSGYYTGGVESSEFGLAAAEYQQWMHEQHQLKADKTKKIQQGGSMVAGGAKLWDVVNQRSATKMIQGGEKIATNAAGESIDQYQWATKDRNWLPEGFLPGGKEPKLGKIGGGVKDYFDPASERVVETSEYTQHISDTKKIKDAKIATDRNIAAENAAKGEGFTPNELRDVEGYTKPVDVDFSVNKVDAKTVPTDIRNTSDPLEGGLLSQDERSLYDTVNEMTDAGYPPSYDPKTGLHTAGEEFGGGGISKSGEILKVPEPPIVELPHELDGAIRAGEEIAALDTPTLRLEQLDDTLSESVNLGTDVALDTSYVDPTLADLTSLGDDVSALSDTAMTGYDTLEDMSAVSANIGEEVVEGVAEKGGSALGTAGQVAGGAMALYGAYNLAQNWDEMSGVDKALGATSTALGGLAATATMTGIGAPVGAVLGLASMAVGVLDMFWD